jgi:hypothetical protein
MVRIMAITKGHRDRQANGQTDGQTDGYMVIAGRYIILGTKDRKMKTD